MRLSPAVVFCVLLAPLPSWADEANQCSSPQQIQQETIERYAIKEVYSMFSKCGIGDLLNFGLSDVLGSSPVGSDACLQPLDYLSEKATKEVVDYVDDEYIEGVEREINKKIREARRSAKTGEWIGIE